MLCPSAWKGTLSVYMRIAHYGNGICVYLLKAVVAVNLQQRKRLSLTGIHKLKVVSECKCTHSVAILMCLRKQPGSKVEMDAGVCFRFSPLPFHLCLLYWYFTLQPDNPNLCFALAYNGHHALRQRAEHGTHPLNHSPEFFHLYMY